MANKSKEELELESEKLKLEREKLALEKERMDFEKLRYDVGKLRLQQIEAQRQHDAVEKSLRQNETEDKVRQSRCNHRKGGKGMAGVQGKGEDGYFAIIHHRMPNGKILVMCSRCQLAKVPGDPGYDEMLNAPTDNHMSSATQFTFREVRLPVNA